MRLLLAAFLLAPHIAPAQPSTSTTNVVVVDVSDLQTPPEEMFNQAVDFQTKGDPARAIQLYTEFITFHPEHKLINQAIHQMAECYAKLGRFPDATKALHLNRQKFPIGDWVEPGWLLEGEMLARDKKWAEAIPALDKVANSRTSKIRIRANYLATLARNHLKTPDAAEPYLQRLAEEANNNPHLDWARVRLAQLRQKQGKADEAWKLYDAAIKHTTDATLRSEAAVLAGNLAYEKGDYRNAAGYFEVVRRTEAPPQWLQLANLGLIRSHFQLKDYPAVIQAFDRGKTHLPDQARAEILFLLAEANRLTGKEQQALRHYDTLLQDFPNHDAAEPSAWARLLILQKQPPETFAPETALYLSKFPNSERADTVKLFRADAFYAMRQFSQASIMFEQLERTPTAQKLEPKLRADFLFKRGHSAFEAGKHAIAADTLENFSLNNSGHIHAASGIWMAAQSRLQLKQEPKTLENIEWLIQDHPQAPMRLPALWLAGTLSYNLTQWQRARNHLAALIREDPKTKHLAEAHYLMAHCYGNESRPTDAKPHWTAARKLNPDSYTAEASRWLINHALTNRDLEELIREVAAYDQWLAANPSNSPVDLDIYEWIAQQLAMGKQPARAESYLRKVIAETKDKEQRHRSQFALAELMSLLENHGGAIREWNAYRLNYPDEANRSPILEKLAQAYIGAAGFDQATQLAEQILRQNPEGEYNARGRLLLGDIAYAQRDFQEASTIYGHVALLIEDPILTPLAKAKAEEAKKQIPKP